VRIDAPGYALAVSRAFKPEEGRQVLDFALQRAPGITGIVCLPDGKPASGADVGLSTWQTQVRLRFGKFDPNANFPKASTGSDGRFSFPPRSGKFLVVALADTGYAEATSDELARSGKLVLQAWGRIDGGVRIGARFGPNQQVLFHPIRLQGESSLDSFSFGYWTQTDERGRFQFDRVVPGPGTVARVVRDDPRPSHPFRQLECWPERIEVKPGETAQVTLGGKGRPVIGRIVLDGTPEAPIDWTLNLPVMLGVPPEKSDPKRFGLLVRGSALFAAHIKNDGRFRIDDVPAGKYELELEVGEDPSLIDRVKQTVVVPAFVGDRSDEPFDLGPITAKVRQGIKIGDLAPDFDVQCIGTKNKGQRLKLSDYRGKLVLLNFWQAEAGRQNDMTVLKEVQASFGHDPRFVLISLACGKSAAQAEQSIKQDGLNWTHGFAGDFVTGAATRYDIRVIYQSQFIIGPDQKSRQVPLTFLIGPDGRIVAHDMSGNDPGAVGKALENPKLFPARR
jgi:peroxiredoxin